MTSSFIVLISLHLASYIRCSTIIPELDLSLVAPYEIKPACSNCSNSTQLIMDNLVNFSQEIALKNLKYQTEANIVEFYKTESVLVDEETTHTLDLTSSVTVGIELPILEENISSVNVSNNTASLVLLPDIFVNTTNSNSNKNDTQLEINSANQLFNTTQGSSTIISTLMNKDEGSTTNKKVVEELLVPNIEQIVSRGFSSGMLTLDIIIYE